jgi:putative membrane protein
MRTLFAAIIAVAGLAGAAFAADPAKKPPSTEAFLSEVAVGNQFEIESSRLAVKKSKSDPVRNFANKVFMDHTEAGTTFTKVIADANLPAPATALDAKHKAILDDLASKEGAAFDQAFIQAQQKAHVETVALFEAYASGGDNASIKEFARKLLPILHSHLEHANKLP